MPTENTTVEFTPENITFLLGFFSQVTVNPSAKDAVFVVSQIKDIISKISPPTASNN